VHIAHTDIDVPASVKILGTLLPMSKVMRIVAVVTLSLSLGMHWAALQSLAWTSMFLARFQAVPLLEALRTTFDGEHPCQLCLVVRDGKSAEQRDPVVPAPWTKSVLKLELFVGSVTPLVVLDVCSVPRPQISTFFFSSRSDPPPRPPPRV
jgi:hypothetical protein